MSRYDIYELIGQYVESDLPQHYGGKKLLGVVENVFCDNIKNQLEVKLKKGKNYIFRIPKKIIKENDIITLYYPLSDATDEEVLIMNKNNAFDGKGIDDNIKELIIEDCEIVFTLKEKPKERRRRRKS